MYTFLVHLSADGHLGYFHVLSFLNSVAMNIGLHVSLSILVSSVCMPSSGIAGSSVSSVQSLSRVQLLATPQTAAHQTPPSMGFSRQEYWSGVPLPSPLQQLGHGNNLDVHWQTNG